MNIQEEKIEVAIEELKESTPSPTGDGVVLHTDALVNGELRDTSIEVSQADAPAVVVALLNPDPPANAAPDLPDAVHCLSVGVMQAASEGQVRLHLLFESGQILPIEMSHAAAQLLYRGLGDLTGVEQA